MVRVVVVVLVVAQSLVPSGLCVHKLGVPNWLARTTAGHDQHSDDHAVAAEKHVSKCCSGHRAPSRDTIAGDAARSGHEPAPDDQEPDPCSRAFCQAKSDQIVQRDHPQVDGPATLVEVLPFEPFENRPLPPIRNVAVASSPPRYVVFCTFLI